MFLKDLLFPKFCLGCGFLGAYICSNCKKKLSYIEKDICLYCGKASLYGLTHPCCKRNNGIDGFLSIFYYNNLLKSIIKNIKYRLAIDVWKEFCLIIEPERIQKIKVFNNLQDGQFYLEPIPLHRNKLQTRGFNQAKIIALFLKQFLGYPLSESLLRSKNTLSQAQLKNNKARYLNMQGAFAVLSKDAVGNKFILVDDVVTTGSTLKEAGRVLKQVGAKAVLALTIARG